MDLGPHAAYVWSSYAAVAVVFAGLLVWLFADGWRQQHRLDQLEARGIRRRSARTMDQGAEAQEH